MAGHSGTSVTGPRRNFLVCIEKNCACHERSVQGEIPENCPYKILHVIETRRAGLQECPRQSGKTTELVELANDLARTTGKSIYFITMNLDIARNIRQRYVMDRKVRFVSFFQVKDGWMRGQPDGLVVMDELTPGEQKEIEGELFRQEVVAAYWTDR